MKTPLPTTDAQHDRIQRSFAKQDRFCIAAGLRDDLTDEAKLEASRIGRLDYGSASAKRERRA